MPINDNWRRRLREGDDDEANTAVGPHGDGRRNMLRVSPVLDSYRNRPVREEGAIRTACMQFKNMKIDSPQYPIQIGYLQDQVERPKDVDDLVNGMYELAQMGPEQAEIASHVLAFILDLEVDGYKLRTKLLRRMQLEFEGFEEKAESSPQAVLCNAIFLCGIYTRSLLRGEPLHALRDPTWEYLTYMLESRKELFMKHCFQLVKSEATFFALNNHEELEEFLPKLKDLVIDEKEPKETRSAALDTVMCVQGEMTWQEEP